MYGDFCSEVSGGGGGGEGLTVYLPEEIFIARFFLLVTFDIFYVILILIDLYFVFTYLNGGVSLVVSLSPGNLLYVNKFPSSYTLFSNIVTTKMHSAKHF